MRSLISLLLSALVIATTLGELFLMPAQAVAASAFPATPDETASLGRARSEIVFIDPSVRNADVLLAGLSSAATPIVLTADRDGIEQITEELGRHHDLTTVHIVSEGTPGNVKLGSSRLTPDMLDEYRAQIASWRAALADGADLLFWGCAIGQGEDGIALLDRLAALTGADVAASTDDTGALARGGNWTLEAMHGDVTAQAPFSATALAAYDDVLGTVDITVTGTGAPASAKWAVWRNRNDGWGWSSWSGGWDVNGPTMSFSSDNHGYQYKIVWTPIGGCTISPPESGVFGFEAAQRSFSATYSACNVDGNPSTLTGSSVAENQPADTTVGTLSNSSPSAGTLTFELTSLTGTPDNASFAIAGTTLKTAARFDRETKSSYTVRIKTTSSGGVSREDNFTIAVTNVNEAPTAITLSPNTVQENGSEIIDIGNLTASDPDDEGTTHTFELRGGDVGKFTLFGRTLRTAAIFDREAKSTYRVTVRARDPGGLHFEQDVTISVTNANEAPSIAFSSGTATYTGSGAEIVDAGVTVTDVDSDVTPDFSGGSLVVRIDPSGSGAATDTIAVKHVGTGQDQIGVNGNEVSYSGQVMATFTGGNAGSSLVFTLNQRATPASVQALLRLITYQNTAVPAPASKTIAAILSDGDGATSQLATKQISLNVPNVAPTITASSGPLTFTEGDPSLILAPDATVTDSDSANLDGGHLIVSLPDRVDDLDQLAIKDQGAGVGQIGIYGSLVLYGGTTIGTFAGGSPASEDLDISLNSNATPAAVTALMRAVTFKVIATAPPVATHNVRFTLSDGDGGTSTGVTVAVQVRPINRAPTITDIPDQTIAQNGSLAAVNFTVADAITAAASLTVTATSSNTDLLPSTDLVLGSIGTGVIRTIAATPLAGQHGVTTITVKVSDGELEASDTFTFSVTPPNAAPTISDIANATISQDTSIGPVTFTVGDTITAPGSLTVTATSGNTQLVPNTATNIVLGNNGAERTIKVTPAAGQTGSAVITVQVSDGALSATDTFTLTVNAVTPTNTAPTISDIPNQSIPQDGTLVPVSFTVGDGQTAPGALTVTASSSNTDLVPDARITLGTSGGQRTIGAAPLANRSGSTTLTVKVSDGQLSAQDTFTLTVTPVTPVTPTNGAPTVTSVAPQTVAAGGATRVELTVGDAETAPAALAVTATSTNQSAVPNDHLALSGSGAQRSLTINPPQTGSGNATVTISVSDGTRTTTTSFDVTVTPQAAAPVQPSCAGRSRVTTAPAGPGRLKVTVQAQGSGATVSGVRFEQGTNARILVNGATVNGPFPANASLSGAEVTFVVERVTPGQAAHVPFFVTDACGTWPSFVGGGPNAF